jgi:hypothetical protein
VYAVLPDFDLGSQVELYKVILAWPGVKGFNIFCEVEGTVISVFVTEQHKFRYKCQFNILGIHSMNVNANSCGSPAKIS